MRVSRLLLAAAAIIAFAPTTSVGQQDRQRYAVEVILFRQAGIGGGGESPPRGAQSPDAGRIGAMAAEDVRPLSGGELELTRFSNGLAAAPGYEVLAHFGWVQPGWSEQEAIAVVLPWGWTPPTGAMDPFAFVPAGTRLFGTVTVYVSRFLHVRTDLRFQPRGLPATPPLRPLPKPDPLTGLTTSVPEEPAGPRVYSMVQSQRMRSGDLHYLDHPELGMLIQVRPWSQ